MQNSGKKLDFDKENLAEVAEAQNRAFKMIEQHLAEPLKRIEGMGYTRVELASAYLMLAYHALRYGKSKEDADSSFNALSYLARKRMEIKIQERQKKRLH